MEDKQLDKLFQEQLNVFNNLSNKETQWSKVESRLNSTRIYFRKSLLVLILLISIGSVVFLVGGKNHSSYDISNTSTIESEVKENKLNGNKIISDESKTKNFIVSETFVNPKLEKKNKFKKTNEVVLFGAIDSNRSVRNATGKFNLNSSSFLIEKIEPQVYNFYAEENIIVIDSLNIKEKNADFQSSVHEKNKLIGSFKGYDFEKDKLYLKQIHTLKTCKFLSLKSLHDMDRSGIINDRFHSGSVSEIFSKRFSIHIKGLKDFPGRSFQDSTDLAYSFGAIWWTTSKFGFGLAYNQQNIKREFNNNFTGYPNPDVYSGGGEKLQRGLANYKQLNFDLSIDYELYSVQSLSFFASAGFQISKSKPGSLELFFQDNYNPLPVKIDIEENIFSISSFNVGFNVQYFIFQNGGIEAQYKYQIETAKQAIHWESLQRLSIGLFYNL